MKQAATPLIVALSLLTMVPVGRWLPAPIPAVDQGRSVSFYSLVGLLMGAHALAEVLLRHVSPLLPATIVLVLLAKFPAPATLLAGDGPIIGVLLAVPMLARAAAAALMATTAYRRDGGIARDQAATRPSAMIALTLATAMAAPNRGLCRRRGRSADRAGRGVGTRGYRLEPALALSLARATALSDEPHRGYPLAVFSALAEWMATHCNHSRRADAGSACQRRGVFLSRARRAGQYRALGLLVVLGSMTAGAAIAAPVSVTDFTGHKVRLDHPARRIVALTPHLVENLFTAGLGDRVVGTVRYSNYPPTAKRIPRVGGYNSLSLEAIVARQPDLVVAWAEGGAPDIIRRLRALGIAVYVDDPRRPAGIARTIRDLGRLGDTRHRADRAASTFLHRIAALRQHYAHRHPVSLFWEVWSDPLRTLSDAGLTGAVIQLCGGRNVFAHAAALAPNVSIESVIARAPQAIVASGAAETTPHWKAFWQQWPAIPAVAHDHFVTVPSDLISRPTIRLAQGAADLCRGLDRVRRSAPKP